MSVPVVSRHGIFFWLFSTVVRVRFTFLLVALLLGGRSGRGVVEILEWIVVATAGVLVHELGHAAAARSLGLVPSVELYTMGGRTSWRSDRPLSRTERIGTSLAGPALGFAVGAVTWLGLRALPESLPVLVALAARDFLWINLAWGLFNLLPILPLDGAQALESSLRVASPRRTMRIVSLVTGGLVALVAFGLGQPWAAVLAALFAYNNAQALRGMRGIEIDG